MWWNNAPNKRVLSIACSNYSVTFYIINTHNVTSNLFLFMTVIMIVKLVNNWILNSRCFGIKCLTITDIVIVKLNKKECYL